MSAGDPGDANKRLMLWARKNGVTLPAVGAERPDEMWLANDRAEKIMRSAGIAVDRFLSMYPEWYRAKNIGEVLKRWGRR